MNGNGAFPTEAAAPDLWLTLIKSAGMLCIVIAALIVFLYVLKRCSFYKGAPRNRSAIQMLASHHVAPKERVVLLDVLGEKVLIGVTPQHITRLAVIRQKGERRAASPDSDGSFGGALQKAVDGSKKT